MSDQEFSEIMPSLDFAVPLSVEQPPRVEADNQYDSISSVVHKLIDGGAITDGEYTKVESDFSFSESFPIDIDRAAKIYSGINKKPDHVTELPREESQVLLSAKEQFLKVKNLFSEKGIIPAELADSTALLLGEENIVLTEGEAHKFEYRGFDFPDEQEKRGTIFLGKGMLDFMENRLSEAISRLDINMPEGISDAVLMWSLSHEYGHAVKEATRFLELQKRKPDSLSPDQTQKLSFEVGSEINIALAQKIAPDPDIETMLEGSPDDTRWTSRGQLINERFASGFEYIGLASALENAGLTAEQAQGVVNEILGEDVAKFDDIFDAVKYAKSKGITMHKLCSALSGFWEKLREAKMPEIAKNYVYFDAHAIGYLKPLSSNQIMQFTQEYGQ